MGKLWSLQNDNGKLVAGYMYFFHKFVKTSVLRHFWIMLLFSMQSNIRDISVIRLVRIAL